MPPWDLRGNTVGVSPQRGQVLVIPNGCEFVEGAGEAWEVSVVRMWQRCTEELPGPLPRFLFLCFPLGLKSLL